jgi:hypothetical protein
MVRLKIRNHISRVIVDVLTSIVVDRGMKPQSGQTKDYKLVFISCEYFFQLYHGENKLNFE